MLYGSEIWLTTKTERLMLERTHRKILRTIQGLPIRCPSKALTSLLGSRDISSFISQRQLTFINSIAAMTSDDLPRQVLVARLANPTLSGIIPLWNQLLDSLNLPSIEELLSSHKSKHSWKSSIKRLLNIEQYVSLSEDCANYPIGACILPLGKPAKHWAITINDRKTTRKSNFRIRMLVGCDGLELDASRFRRRHNCSTPGDPTCKLCLTEPEDPAHFILRCPSLATRRRALLSDVSPEISAHIPDPTTDPSRFIDVMSGVEWVNDRATQVFIVDYLDQLRSSRNELILSL